METITIPLRPLLIFVVVLARVGGLVTFAPFWSLSAIPVRVRVLLTLLMAFIVAPAVAPQMATPPSDWGGLTLVMLGELAIGCALGFAAQLIFSALEVAAHVLSLQMGFYLSAIINPLTRAQTTPFGTLAQMAGIALMLAGDGHHWLLSATVRSFSAVGIGSFSASAAFAELCLRLSAEALAVGVALAAPAIVVLLAVEFALAIAGRVAPQLQTMLIGFPIKIMVGLSLIGASLYFLPGAFRQVFNVLQGDLKHILDTVK